jgi:DNA-binding PucR family transcriptional regulator
VARRASALGLELDEELVVVVADAAGGDAVGREFVVARHDEVVALVPAARAAAVAMRFTDLSLRAGLSAPCHAASEVPRAYEEARRALRHASPERPVVRLDEVGLADELALSADDVSRSTVPDAARQLAARPDLCATVIAFADHDLNVARTAAALHVHPNTVQYRLRRIEELTGADPRRFHTTLAIVLGLRTLEASTATGPSPRGRGAGPRHTGLSR